MGKEITGGFEDGFWCFCVFASYREVRAVHILGPSFMLIEKYAGGRACCPGVCRYVSLFIAASYREAIAANI